MEQNAFDLMVAFGVILGYIFVPVTIVGLIAVFREGAAEPVVESAQAPATVPGAEPTA